jgi:hypothetical protein
VSSLKPSISETTPIEEVAFRLYTPPFRFEHGYIWDANTNMVADQMGQDAMTRIRGWGRISYKPDAEKLQDAVGELVAKALTEYWEKLKYLEGNNENTNPV